MKTQKIIAWTLFALAAAAGILAHPLNLYARFDWYDEALHTITPATLALIVSAHLNTRLFREFRDHRLLRIFLVVTVTVFLGVVWELAEWLYDMSQDRNTILGKHDTMLDLCFDTAGATAGAIVGMFLAWPYRRRQGLRRPHGDGRREPAPAGGARAQA